MAISQFYQDHPCGRSHAFLDPDKDKEEFWDFDWHETAMYDVPSAIDHILRITGQEKVKYVGHSMGCTEFLTTMTMRPEYNEKVTVAALLAPPAYMSHAPNPIFLVAGFGDLINSLVHLMGMYEFLPNDLLGAILGHAVSTFWGNISSTYNQRTTHIVEMSTV